METKIENYLKKTEEKLEKLGLIVKIKNGLMESASGVNAMIPEMVNRATILTAKLEGFREALELIKKE